MKELERLSGLIKRVKWTAAGYKEYANAYGTAAEGFAEAASQPRDKSWKEDAIIISFLRHCDMQMLSLCSMQKISQILSSDLEKAVQIAESRLAAYEEEDLEQKNRLENLFKEMQSAVEKRNQALEGAFDLWKADIDLKHAIHTYVNEEDKYEKYQEKLKSSYCAVYNSLSQKHHKAYLEYSESSVGHQNILLNETAEVMPKSPEEISLEKYIDQSFVFPVTERTKKEERFTEIYAQAVKEKDAHKGMYPFLVDLSVRGCGVFYLPKSAKHIPVFIVFTSTNYLHAFSITNMLSDISNSLFISDTSVDKAVDGIDHSTSTKNLSLFSETCMEEINMYLMSHIHSLEPAGKPFPLLLKDRKISFNASRKEILIESKATVFFTSRIRLQGISERQTQKFYSLFQPQAAATPSFSAETNPEITISWTSASYDNPW